MAVQTSREPIRPVTGTHVFRIQHEGIATAEVLKVGGRRLVILEARVGAKSMADGAVLAEQVRPLGHGIAWVSYPVLPVLGGKVLFSDHRSGNDEVYGYTETRRGIGLARI